MKGKNSNAGYSNSACHSRLRGNDSLCQHPLYLIADPEHTTHLSFADMVDQAIQGGVRLVQLRNKRDPIADVITQARLLKTLLQDKGIPLIINDYIEVALAVDAAGVHIGQQDESCLLVRERLGADKIIGLTVENLAQGRDAQHLPIDYLGAGPVFPTTSKPDAPLAWGLPQLTELVKLSALPVVAIGGIHQGNIVSVWQSRVAGVAVISAICSAEDPRLAATGLGLSDIHKF